MFCTHCGVALYEGAAFCSACGRPIGAALGEFKPVRVAYAAFWLRIGALLIDYFALTIPSFAVLTFAVVWGGLKLPEPDAPITQIPTPLGVFLATEAALLILQWLYFAIMESSPWRGTL